ncbi:MAG: zinc-ribbon domain-containing protein [Oscillospiraceae bacterium]|nr:zinc-ribbon domain-containing protein [Oscillospiraceae bacterium]
MENYPGKICPFCKTEITEADTVKACPACGVPHHEGCWEENHGCTTLGCSERQREAQQTDPTDACANCGTPLNEGQAFCSICGTPKAGHKKSFCSMCGNELQEGQVFCSRCGQKAVFLPDSGVDTANDPYYAGVDKTNGTKKKKPVKIIVAAVIALTVIAIGALVVPKLFVSVEDLCARGNYEKAYEKADADEKLEIRAENAAAVQSAFSVDNLKDPSSFVLREAYYKEGTSYDGETSKTLVLYISGANSYGASVSSYWLYTWNTAKDKWEYYCSVSDLSAEEISSYDDEDESLEKLVNNIGRASITLTMNDGIKLSKDAVERINAMFEKDTLDEVELLEDDLI